jgi:CRISPR system Cascade subunit CasE
VEASRRSFLFREKQGDRFGRRILILSTDKPINPEFGTIQIKDVHPSFFDKDLYKFSVRMNPVKRLSRSKRCEAITGVDEILSWFLGKSSQYGFSVLSETLELTGKGVQQFDKGEQRIIHNYADITGVLRVEERKIFISSIKKGIGRGKSFGFGLLELIPIQ